MHYRAKKYAPKLSNYALAAGGRTFPSAAGFHTAEFFYTDDSGVTWKKNDSFPLTSNLRATILDPNHASRLFYLFFGGGMLHGPRP